MIVKIPKKIIHLEWVDWNDVRVLFIPVATIVANITPQYNMLQNTYKA